MLSILARLLLTASAIAPVSLTYAWVALMQGEPRLAIYSASVGAIAIVACLIVLNHARKNLEAVEFKTKSIEPADSENFAFMLLYLLPLFTDRVGALNWEVWIPIILIFSIITATGYGYHFNPLLGIMQWHFYKITSEDGVTYVLITKKHLRTAAGPLVVGQLTEYILIDLGES